MESTTSTADAPPSEASSASSVAHDYHELKTSADKDLELFYLLYENIKSLKQQCKREDERKLIADFDSVWRRTQHNLMAILVAPGDSIDHSAMIAELLVGQQQLFAVCVAELADYCHRSVSPALSLVIQGVLQLHSHILHFYPKLVQETHRKYASQLAIVRTALETARAEADAALHAAEILEKENQEHERQRQRWNKQRRELLEELEKYRGKSAVGIRRDYSDNRVTTTHANGSPTSKLASMQATTTTAPQIAPHSDTGGRSISPSRRHSQSGALNGNPAGAASPYSKLTAFTAPVAAYLPLPLPNPSTASTEPSARQSPASDRSAGSHPGSPPTTPTGRVLTLRQLKELIEEIYTSKERYDERCTTLRLPRETLEQHLYTFLNRKYGLKPLVLDWAQTVQAAVAYYGKIDQDVAVFGKILANELDEDFRLWQLQLKDTVAMLLRGHLRHKFPHKAEKDIEAIVKRRTSGTDDVVYRDEWEHIVRHMYNESDCALLLEYFKELDAFLSSGREKQHSFHDPPRAVLALHNSPMPPHALLAVHSPTKKHEPVRTAGNTSNNNALPAGAIPYSMFVGALLDFRLKMHEKLILKFTRLFKLYDKDKDGVIGQPDFSELVSIVKSKAVGATKPTDDVIETYVRTADPWNTNMITFSECVRVLSQDLLEWAKAEATEKAMPAEGGESPAPPSSPGRPLPELPKQANDSAARDSEAPH